MKRIKRGLVAILVILMTLQMSLITLAATQIPSATAEFYVNDFAEVFTVQEKERLIKNAVSLSDEYNGIQIVVTTITSLNGDTIENYAFNMYNQYGIGKDDMGILILLSTGDRKIRVEVGKAMETYVNDAKAGRFMDKYAIPYLKENKFNEGLINLQENLINEIVSKVKTEEQKTTVSATVETEKISKVTLGTILLWFLAIILGFGLVLLIILLIKKSNTKKKETKNTIKNLEEQLETTKNLLEKEKQNHILDLDEAEKNKYEQIRFFEEKEKSIVSTFEQKIADFKFDVQSLKSQNWDLTEKNESLKNELSILKDRYQRVNTLYPSADKDVDKMIEEEVRQKDMSEAKKVDDAIAEVIKLSADKDRVFAFQEVISKYSNLTETQKSYLQNDISVIQKLLKDSIKLKEEYEKKLQDEKNKKSASEASETIKSILAIATVGNESNLKELRRARKIYDSLSRDALTYFDNSLITKISKLLKSAEADYEEKQRIRGYKSAAKKAEDEVESIISYSYGRASELSKLKRALSIYEGLNRNVQEYFDEILLRKLKDLIEKAKRDKKREEEEEERRRKSYNSSFHSTSSFGSSSGFGSSSSFGGFGGSSGGGGASRGF